MCSPLGIWLLLCACLTGTDGPERAELQRIVSCTPTEAGEHLDTFLSDVPPAVHAALALRARESIVTERLTRWRERLPAQIESGPIPTSEQADAWADRHTLGLIERFGLAPAELRLVLASALATRVSWEQPYDVAPIQERFSAQSPWRDAVERVLCRSRPTDTAIVDTCAAGLVAVHEAVAQEDLRVVCVSGDPVVDRGDVLAAAHEVAGHVAAGSPLAAVSLFDLPLGDGHSWTLAERDRPAPSPGRRFETISDIALPAWELDSTLLLLESPAFGARAATGALRRMIGEEGPSDARQVALARFDRYGFKAAALTFMAVPSARVAPPTHTGVERVAGIRLDHPFAAIAVTGQETRFRGLPVFEAWVRSPAEVPEDGSRA